MRPLEACRIQRSMESRPNVLEKPYARTRALRRNRQPLKILGLGLMVGAPPSPGLGTTLSVVILQVTRGPSAIVVTAIAGLAPARVGA